jgi:hypothetical protein
MSHFRLIELLLVLCVVALGCGLGSDVPPKEKRIYQIMHDRSNELGATVADVKLDASVPMKGKVAIVFHENNYLEKPEDYRIIGFTQYMDDIAAQKVLEPWGLTRENIATKPDEIDTLVRITCTKGRRIGDYPAERRAPIPAYGIQCLVDVMNYKTATIFARETLENLTIEKANRPMPVDESITAWPPYEDIYAYVKNFRRSS